MEAGAHHGAIARSHLDRFGEHGCGECLEMAGLGCRETSGVDHLPRSCPQSVGSGAVRLHLGDFRVGCIRARMAAETRDRAMGIRSWRPRNSGSAHNWVLWSTRSGRNVVGHHCSSELSGCKRRLHGSKWWCAWDRYGGPHRRVGGRRTDRRDLATRSCDLEPTRSLDWCKRSGYQRGRAVGALEHRECHAS